MEDMNDERIVSLFACNVNLPEEVTYTGMKLEITSELGNVEQWFINTFLSRQVFSFSMVYRDNSL